MIAQVSETIIIEDEEFSLLAEPLAPLLEEKEVEFTTTSNDCLRGYIGTWELKDDALHLIAFNRNLGDRIIELKDLFNKEPSLPIKATWFSGELKIPIDKSILLYSYGGHSPSVSDELIIKIDKGNVVSFIYESIYIKKIRELTSHTMFSDETFYHDVYKVVFKDSFNITRNEMIDIINKNYPSMT